MATTFKWIAVSLGYLLLAVLMAFLSWMSFGSLSIQYGLADPFWNSNHIILAVFLAGTSIAGLVYFMLAFWRQRFSAIVVKRLHQLSFISLLPAFLRYLWMFLFHVGL